VNSQGSTIRNGPAILSEIVPTVTRFFYSIEKNEGMSEVAGITSHGGQEQQHRNTQPGGFRLHHSSRGNGRPTSILLPAKRASLRCPGHGQLSPIETGNLLTARAQSGM
jgi:hypothetical protein